MKNEKQNSWNEKWQRQLAVAEKELLRLIEKAEAEEEVLLATMEEVAAQHALVKLIQSQIVPPE